MARSVPSAFLAQVYTSTGVRLAAAETADGAVGGHRVLGAGRSRRERAQLPRSIVQVFSDDVPSFSFFQI